MENPREKWNRRWTERAEESAEPDEWLVRIEPLISVPGKALDIACGAGRNALYLAERGWTVTGVDIAEQGLALLEGEAARRGLPLTTRTIDLEAEPFLPSGPFELVLLFFYLQRSLFPAILSSVRPGGLAVVRTFSAAGEFPGAPGNSDFVLRPGELIEIFAGWDILRHEEGVEPARRGGGLAGIVARRPDSES
jgi:tellurite methyltransferase